MRIPITAVLLISDVCRLGLAQVADDDRRLRRRDEVPGKPSADGDRSHAANGVWVVPAGTKIPIQLRQAVSTKNAQPGDPIYGQTTFPVIVDNLVMIPAGTFVKV